ncbi:MAG: hypothetical protein PVI01_06385, partial [Gemmatimonadales bacterium]
YEFRPTDGPLRYRLREYGTLRVETPVGVQTATDSTHAVVAIDVAGDSDGGREVMISFDELESWAGGDFPRRHVTGTELVGHPFIGVLQPSGLIDVSTTPEIPEDLAAAIDPTALVTRLLPPLPPGGEASAPPWPHRAKVTINTATHIELTYDGTASFAGDTTWDGRSGRVIVWEGIVTGGGRGRPAGAPGEVEFDYTGRYVTHYIWDPATGVMLASTMTSESEGELEVKEMQSVMPITHRGRTQVTLAR